VKYRSVPIGRISRERLARHIVHLIEEPRRALFISRIYEGPVLINKLFPEFVDWISGNWVRRKHRQEHKFVPPASTVARYPSAFSLWQLVGGLSMFALVTLLWRRGR
jgi:hypothetical protein